MPARAPRRVIGSGKPMFVKIGVAGVWVGLRERGVDGRCKDTRCCCRNKAVADSLVYYSSTKYPGSCASSPVHQELLCGDSGRNPLLTVY